MRRSLIVVLGAVVTFPICGLGLLLRFVTGSMAPIAVAVVVVVGLGVVLEVRFWRIDHPKRREPGA